MEHWMSCKNLLCIKPDNMGDIIMSGPAIRAFKEKFKCNITLLCSSMGKPITPCIAEINDIIVFDLPWVKVTEEIEPDNILQLVELLKNKSFDAAVIFTTYSQSALPAAMLVYLAGIPRRLAYSRENP